MNPPFLPPPTRAARSCSLNIAEVGLPLGAVGVRVDAGT